MGEAARTITIVDTEGTDLPNEQKAIGVAKLWSLRHQSAKHVEPRAGLPTHKSPRRATFTFLNHSSASSRPAFVAFFHRAHSAFSLRANTEAGRADHHTDTRRRRPFLDNPAPLRWSAPG